MNSRRTLLSTLALGALLALVAVGPATAGTGVVRASGALRDLQPTVVNSTDGASARLSTWPDGGGTSAKLIVTGINDSVGTVYGAHAHTGPCVAGDGAAAGPHYNSASPPIIDVNHELWLDFKVVTGGTGTGSATVPFVIPSGAAKSVVIHIMATHPFTGAAGARQACLPVAF